MVQNGGCCIARSYTNNAHNMSKVDSMMMMMKFRPIAPKPASPTTNLHVTTEKTNTPVTKPTGRGKRRNPNSTNGTTRKRKSPSPEKSTSEVKTFSFLPETPGVKDINITPCKKNFPTWLSFGNNHVTCDNNKLFNPVRQSSLIKIECVMDTWMDYSTVRCTDEGRVMGLSLDTCPSFLTDGLNRVTWTNAAFKRMVGGDGEVAVVVEEGVVVPVGVAGFTCRVRVVGKGSKTVPCDVWRMECGGFAWRLDTMVALSLGW